MLSPDGSRLSYLAPVDGVLNIWVGPSADPAAAQPVTDDRGSGIRTYRWAYTGRHLLYLQDRGGDENWQLSNVDLTTGRTIDLTAIEGVHAAIAHVSPRHPNEVVVGLNDRDVGYHDLYTVNILTGDRRLIRLNDGFDRILTDDDFEARLAYRITPDGGSEILQATGESGWEPFIKVGPEDSMTTRPRGFDDTGRTLYMVDSRGRDTAALTSIDLESGEETVLAHDPRSDAGELMVHPMRKRVQAVAFTYERLEWKVVDQGIASDMAYLGTVSPGELEVVSRSLDDGRWIVAYMVDDGPMLYYLYDRTARRAEFLFADRPGLEGWPLAKMRPVVIKSRDGLDLVCYYMLPVGSDGDGRPDKPLPMVLDVHGGPWSRDAWGYDPRHQWATNRGYAAMTVNFRGSTGFGKRFINAGDLEWGGKMQDDLTDAIQWAIGQGIADPDRIAILGASYGGYAALAGLTFTPDTFACAVDLVGPSNLVTMVETIPPYWKPIIQMEAKRIGDSRTPGGRALLKARSPITHVDRISRPLLIGHGANDARVKRAESDQIVEAMRERGIPVTYLLYLDEGHRFARPENRLSFNAVAEAFLAQHLGGRLEPIGDDFTGSSMTAVAGAEQVPAFAEALARR